MRIILIIISICISIQARSQAEYMIKNFKYQYSLTTIDNQTYIDTVSFEFQLRKKYKKHGKEISAIIFNYGLISDSMHYKINSDLYKKNELSNFLFKPAKKGIVIHKRSNIVIFKVPFLGLKIKELNYSFLTAWFMPEYHYIYAKEDELFFLRERLYFGSITITQYNEKELFFRKNFPAEKRKSSNFLDISIY